ncbi:MAG: hypothetical protein JO286_06205 [Solirubrobacterales bacterium]|nr:hypothetical protein [Solirubrobacterales bacterium]MBV9806755.1 hypothetical protein [Solirubrobacterales bacterium]
MRDPDREVLAFAVAHHLILADHVASLLGSDADATRERLARLHFAGLIRRTRMLATHPGGYQITSAGLAAIASDLPPPRFDPRRYRHDIGAGWLWLAATTGGNFGPVEQVLSERQMQAHDTKRNAAELEAEPSDRRPDPTEPIGPCLGVHRGGTEVRPSTGLHYPDLLLITPAGRVPIELELSARGAERLGAIMSGYAAHPNIRGVLYMTDDHRVARLIDTLSTRLGISELIHLQRIRFQALEPA